MDFEKQRAELKKALLEKGMTAESADDVVYKAFPFQKDEDKKGDEGSKDSKDDVSKGCAEDKDDMSKATTEEPADLDKLAKGLEDLRSQLTRPAGLSNGEVQEEISKAIAAEVDPIKRHATAVAQTADLLVKAQQEGMETLRKGLEQLTATVGGIVNAMRNPPELLAKSLEQENAVKDLQNKLADLTKENEDLRKSLTTKPKAVATELEIERHPGDPAPNSQDFQWTEAAVLKKALEIRTAPGSSVADQNRAVEKHNEIVFALSALPPAVVARRFNLEAPK